MEKRIGAAIILVEDKENIEKMNELISMSSSIIIGRQGIPIREKGISVITLTFEGSNDQISSLTGKLGKLQGLQVKSVLTRYE